MIDYQTFHQLRQLHDQEHLSVAQIAAALQLDERTVGKWVERPTYQPRQRAARPSKLEAYKGTVVRLRSRGFGENLIRRQPTSVQVGRWRGQPSS